MQHFAFRLCPAPWQARPRAPPCAAVVSSLPPLGRQKTLSDPLGLRYIKGMNTKVAPVRQDLLDRIRAVVGDKGCLTDAGDMAPYLNSWRDSRWGRSPMVVRPASTQEVAGGVTLCHGARTPIVPQAGNTGLTGGSTPSMSGDEIVLS